MDTYKIIVDSILVSASGAVGALFFPYVFRFLKLPEPTHIGYWNTIDTMICCYFSYTISRTIIVFFIWLLFVMFK